ncbi:lysophospholipid acyltransferase family protein [Allonocardiopsis opalescens]|uniref:1-acyl-sn-glycerol-3-phosphate acyltransferase n=1 Tax=Allonocardiopsis opalescens TaxID=1144618 RepID=A0A2T0Q4Q4_9ACTN|nr:lysophospholipid acyltransferase family protein [Allonocardiopsis opalescens]PRX98798.1 1-acyl-sn-glycerol-3-phosphate acyltransferase [Allonocardiopsis opalescens]
MFYELSRRVGSVLGRAVYRPAIEGLHHIPAAGPVILASNHLSFVDSVVIPLAVPRRVRFLAKAEYFDGAGVKGALSRWVFASLGAVPVQRGTGRDAMAALREGLKVLEAGQAFGIYPEGTRSRDGRLYRGRTGVAFLALSSGAPVVPVALSGTEKIQPVGARLPRIAPIRIRFGAPLTFTGYDSMPAGRARREVTDRVMAAIGELSGQPPAEGYSERADAA